MLEFKKPSNIQAISIPLIVAEPHHDLIAQARNGCGKTGSFTIGSALRVDRDLPADKVQILVIANTRELVNQIHSVYEKIVRSTGITLENTNDVRKPAQILVTTHGKLLSMLEKRPTLDLSHLKCIVVDEADVFFLDDKNFQALQTVAKNKEIIGRPDDNRVQWILFSATYPEGTE